MPSAAAAVDQSIRLEEKASDHAPTWVEIAMEHAIPRHGAAAHREAGGSGAASALGLGRTRGGARRRVPQQ